MKFLSQHIHHFSITAVQKSVNLDHLELKILNLSLTTHPLGNNMTKSGIEPRWTLTFLNIFYSIPLL